MNKFDTLLEGVFTRFQGGGFLTGDLVKLKSDALTSPWAKNQQDNLLQKLKEFSETDENIRISSVKALRPAVSGSVQQDEQVDAYYCDIVREKAPGMFTDFVTVPADMLEYIEFGTNLPPIPDSQRRKNDITGKPEELKEEEESHMSPYKQTGVKEGDKSLKNTNVDQDHTLAPTDNFNTKVYMQGI
tara:strand:- start:364 stop:924 length:561 start_codon:yes stop_codon:yes gene_type:complete